MTALSAVADTPHWSTRFAYPGLSDYASRVFTWRGRTVAIGHFSTADGEPTVGCAAWDGTRWTSLARDLTPFGDDPLGPRLDRGIVWNDMLVVGGNFHLLTPAGDSLVNFGLYDGTTWHAMPGVPRYRHVGGFAVFHGRLFARGGFGFGTQASPVDDVVIEWDAARNTWMPRGPNFGGYPQVLSLVATADTLYASGSFSPAYGPDRRNGLLAYDGAQWHETAPAGDDGGLGVHAFAYHGAVLDFDTYDRYIDPGLVHLQRWNGAGWDRLADVSSREYIRAWTSDDSVYVEGGRSLAGGEIIRRWDGTHFIDVADLPRGYPNAVGGGDRALLVSGTWDGDPVFSGRQSVIYDGARWRIATALHGTDGLLSPVSAIVLRDDKPWFATLYASESRVPAAVWTGSAWQTPGGTALHPLQPVPYAHTDPTFLMLAAAGDVAWTDPSSFPRSLRVWDGARITDLALGALSVPRCLTHANGRWVIGSDFRSTNPTELVFEWEGGRWNALGALQGAVYALHAYRGTLYAGGFLTTFETTAGHALAAWDGAAWHSVGELQWDATFGSVPGAVVCFGEWRGALVVGGDFSRVAPGVRAANVALWDGTRWSACGDGVDGSVTAIGVFHGDLVVAGNFQHAGSVAANGIARWDGAHWSAFGAGLAGGTVSALVSWHNTLLAGGDFTSAGGFGSNYVAMWEGEAGTRDDTLTTSATHLAFAASPPCVVATSATFDVHVDAPATLRAWMLDARGRVVRQLAATAVGAGTHTLTWNGETDAALRAPSGLYWLRVETADARLDHRVVVIR